MPHLFVVGGCFVLGYLAFTVPPFPCRYALIIGSSCLSPLQFELDDAPAIEVLLAAYPEPVRVYDLPHPPTEDLEDKVQ